MHGGEIIVFTGTSGAGRKTIARRVSQALELTQVASATTRPPRNPDRLDTDYHYMSEEQFNRLAQEGAFLQTVEIDRHRYGIVKQEAERALSKGHGISLVLNREGADAVKQWYGDRVIRIFVYVDKTTVRERLESKGARFEQIESYLDHYADEVTYRKQCEYTFENVDLERTAERITAVIREARQHERVRDRP